MLIDLGYLDNKNCPIYHNEGYMHCSWMVGKHVVTVEYICDNYPPLTVCAWESLAEWWKAVSDVVWLDLAPVAKELLEGDDVDQPTRELVETWLREHEEDEDEESQEEEL